MWLALLAGPVVGSVYFWAVYLLAEAGCSEGLGGIDEASLRVLLLAVAAGAAAMLLIAGVIARRVGVAGGEPGDEQSGRDLRATAQIVIGLTVAFVLFVTAPVIGSSLC